MAQTIAQVVLLLSGGYAALGAVFGAWFAFRGVERVDHAARGAKIGFRLIILPGVAAFWPLFLLRWRRAAAGTEA